MNHPVAQKKIAKVIDYKKTFGTTEGQRVLWDMMLNAHVLTHCFRKDKDEAIFHDGERNTVLRILTILKMDPAKMQDMIQKHTEENNDA